ncbi:signal peptidase I [Streptomyces echinoruber]|uniref:Signal peptidase I n=1 Tax=Streptomyces echinoruber TaxID=68898 RepID=A0A918RK45_9ACTN|nr:signal peptidase I [Streptomyces echinoruber]
MGNRGRPRRGAPVTAVDSLLPTGARRAAGAGVAGRTRVERRKLQRKVKRKRRRSAVKEIPLLVGVAVLIALVLKTFLVQAFVIPSGSMEQTIRIGDRVLVDKLTPWFGSKPQRGDVVVFHDPGGWLADEQVKKKNDPVVVKQVKEGLTFIGLLPSDNEKDLIKRVVGVGGDHVKCCDAQGRVTVNGVPLNEDYLYPGNAPSTTSFDITVPQGRLWVMGDHRANSADSRFHQDTDYGGTVSERSVVGRAMVIAWPFGHWSTLKEPKTYASVGDAAPASTAAPRTSHKVASDDPEGAHPNGMHPNGVVQLPSPAELPLVMGVVGLHRVWSRPRDRVRSWRGGCGGWRTVRTRRRGTPRAPRGGFLRGRRRDLRERIRSGRGRQGDGRAEPDRGTAAQECPRAGRRAAEGQEATLLLEGAADPDRDRAGAGAADQDVPGAGVLHPVRLHAEHPADG